MLHLIMVISTLVMTAVRVFGEFIQKALEDSGQYSVTLVNDQKELIRLVQTGEIQAAVLDMELEPDPIKLVTKINEINPKLAIILFNDKKKNGGSNFLGTSQVISYEGVLRTSDLLKVLENLTAGVKGREEAISKHRKVETSFPSRIVEGQTASDISQQEPEWLGDINGVAQVLTQLTLESAAHAALITRNADLWAYAGHLSRPAAEELAQSLWNYWDHDGGSDLAQFILLEATRREYILYATGLGGEFVLGLAFEAAIPFSEMRTQASMLAKRLTTPPEDLPQDGREPAIHIVETFDDTLEQGKGIPSTISSKLVNLGKAEEPGIPDSWQDDEVHDEHDEFHEELLHTGKIHDLEIEKQIKPMSRVQDQDDLDSFSDTHSEDRQKKEIGIEEPNSIPEEVNDNLQKSSIPGSIKDLLLSDPLKGNDQDDAEERAAEELEWSELFERFFDNKATRQSEDAFPSWDSVGGMKEQRVHGTLEADSSRPTSNELAFTCVLIPRLPHHYLEGDLADFLKRWIEMHAIAFGWCLGRLVINRDYLQWVGILSPDLAPGQMVEDLRIHSSNEIFPEYPRLKRENPSGDFWARDKLIYNGPVIPDQVLISFLKKTRNRQGINRK